MERVGMQSILIREGLAVEGCSEHNQNFKVWSVGPLEGRNQTFDARARSRSPAMPPKGSKKEVKDPVPSSFTGGDQQNPLKFTSFQVIGFLNGKNVASNFVKSDNQAWTSRRSNDVEWDKEREGKRRRLMASEEQLEAAQAVLDGKGETGEVVVNVLGEESTGKVKQKRKVEPVNEDDEEDPQDEKLSKTIIIHPGSRFIRIGRASDAFPLSIPNAIATQSTKSSLKPKSFKHSFVPPPPSQTPTTDVHMNGAGADDEDDELSDDNEVPADANTTDPVGAKISSIRGDLRARMRSFKLRGQGNGNAQAMAYNEQVRAEPTPGYSDPNEVAWTETEGGKGKEFYVGDEALAIPDPEKAGYILRHPFDRGAFDTTDYQSSQEFLGDIERIWLSGLNELGIEREDLKDYSAILIIPDLYDHVYVREMTDLVLKWMGFKQVCLQQESICATFGAGLSSACVIDIGAKKTSITCVEEGLVLPETRMLLDFAGDDITEFLLTLLVRTGFPYKEADLTRWYDWTVLEDLKEKMIVLSEGDVGLNIYDFYVRAPNAVTKKYMLRVYDDVILAPYALFAPRVVDFERKSLPDMHLWSRDVDDIFEVAGDLVTNAMRSSTRHLLPPAPIASASAEPDGITPAPITTEDGAALPPLPPLPATTLAVPSPTPGADLEAGGTGTKAPTRQTTPAKEVSIDVRVEASKMPLDVAVLESILAAGTEDRMKKVCQNVLIVGGSGLIHNVGFAVESRVSPQLGYRVPSLAGQMAIVPPPREIDPRILAWKGISVLSKLDSSIDLWVRREDWEALGMRAVKERAFFFA
ncbi:actin-related protein 8 [Pseudohyphozyma bogoriensis]|nr:actin-related protein 8 [Pseudohyphozyma bogoriensis]